MGFRLLADRGRSFDAKDGASCCRTNVSADLHDALPARGLRSSESCCETKIADAHFAITINQNIAWRNLCQTRRSGLPGDSTVGRNQRVPPKKFGDLGRCQKRSDEGSGVDLVCSCQAFGAGENDSPACALLRRASPDQRSLIMRLIESTTSKAFSTILQQPASRARETEGALVNLGYADAARIEQARFMSLADGSSCLLTVRQRSLCPLGCDTSRRAATGQSRVIPPCPQRRLAP